MVVRVFVEAIEAQDSFPSISVPSKVSRILGCSMTTGSLLVVEDVCFAMAQPPVSTASFLADSLHFGFYLSNQLDAP